jgi:pyrroloquinoline quinone biosynthesis protein B
VQVRVLGSAAGGGFPQWNCGCANCRAARSADGRARPRTQESVALSARGDEWFLFNASPEIRAQIESFTGLWPRAPRHSPIAGLLLTNGDLDHCLGLLSLRESHPLVVYATAAVRDGFTSDNVLYRTLERFPGQVEWRTLALGQEQPLGDASGGLFVTAVPAPPLEVQRQLPRRGPSPEDNVGFVIRDAASGRRVAYLSGVAGPSPDVERSIGAADLVFFDGTFWSSDELIAAGLGTRRAEDMAHWPVGGPEGSLAFFARAARPAGARAVYIHINNTNPMLIEDSAERAAVRAAGLDVAEDGMELGMEVAR